MQINTINSNNNYNKNISFSGQRLFSLNLIKTLPSGAKEKVPAYFTQIDATDIPLLKKVGEYFEDTQMGKNILTGIFNKIEDKYTKNKFFMIECPQMKNVQDKVRALCACFNSNNVFSDLEISLLQSASEIISAEKLSGGGVSILRGLCKYIEDKKQFNSISWVSAPGAVNWYRKLNVEESKNFAFTSFSISRKNITKFLNETSKKYGDIIPVKE